jgi:hypothetical protein
MSKGSLFCCALLLSVGATFLATPAQSHTGTDESQGCHTDPRTREYHCHTPKNPPSDPVVLTYCHVMVGRGSRCGYELKVCNQLVSQFGGYCQQSGFSFGVR